jgi:hypothetical protein
LYRTIFDPFASSFLRRISYLGFWIWYFASSVYQEFCLCLNLCIFGPLSTNKGVISHFDSFAFCQISYRCFWIRYLASSVHHKILRVFESRLCFGPLSTNKGLVLNFGPFALGQISYRCFWIWYFAFICLAFLSVFESRLFFALFPATRDLHCILIHFHLARFLTDACGFEIASSF